MPLNKQDKEFINLSLQGVHARIDANHALTAMELKDINEKVTKQNSRVFKLEERMQKRDETCNTIQALKEDDSKYKFWKISAMIVLSAIIASIIINVGLWEFLKILK